jgi:hypothetical protein
MNTTVFTAIRSGQFNNTQTWQNNTLPTDNSSIIILAGVTVDVDRERLDLNIKRCDLYGTLNLGSTRNQSFRFDFPINLIVYETGVLEDKTAGKQIISPEGMLMTIYPGGRFIGDGSALTSYNSSGSTPRMSRSLAIVTSPGRPYTCATLPGGDIPSFPLVTSIVIASASFGSVSAWAGGVVPSAAICLRVGTCGMSVSPGYILSTAILNGRLPIRYSVLLIATGSRFQMGALGFSGGFRFEIAIVVNIFGILEDVTGTAGGIFIPLGSSVNFFAGARFISIIPTFLIIIDPITGRPVGQPFGLSSAIVPPFFITISLTGIITTSTSGKLARLQCVFSFSFMSFPFQNREVTIHVQPQQHLTM